jgi:hypothetical protein
MIMLTGMKLPGFLYAAELIQPEDLLYQGAFRLPDISGECDWTYSGHAMTFFPDGDSKSGTDGYPGSIFASGNDAVCQYVSEISIPRPVISASKDPSQLNIAKTLQPFQDIRGGMFGDHQNLTIPRVGLAYLPAQGEQNSAKLHFCWAQHLQDFEASHGWCELDLSNPRPKGPWKIGHFTNYVTNDYIFQIPREWSDRHTPGKHLVTGRAREGLWSGRGPALFAYSPWEEGNPPPSGGTLKKLIPLLLYGKQQQGLPEINSDASTAVRGYSDADHWFGGAWLTMGDKSALIFAGTKAIGKTWYGYANGVMHEYDCYEANTPPCPQPQPFPYSDRGFWAERYEAQIIFYNPDDLAAVAAGRKKSWEPQPYASLKIDKYLYDPFKPDVFENHLARYKRDYVGAICFDRTNGFLYIMERQADEEKSLIHVWKVKNGI